MNFLFTAGQKVVTENGYQGEVVAPFVNHGIACYVVRFDTGFVVHEFNDENAMLYDDIDAEDPAHLFVYAEPWLNPVKK